MKKLFLALITLSIISCNNTSQDLIVKGHVKGLKKGTLYLEKVQDSSIIILDSLLLKGDSNFELSSALEVPEALYLRLDKNSTKNTDNRIVFFADKGITEINTTLKNFVVDATIKGSKQQALYEDYLKVMSRFNDKSLELYKDKLEAIKSGDSSKINESQIAINKLIKSKYLYTVNFAVTNNDSEIAPYLALSEVYDAQPKWLDTINQSLTPRIKDSKYGKILDNYILELKEN
ncbi:DUF4369 domain-containing protein [Mangrovimonas spongiae]|uniref:DUF4369 domain-containing protein n=1 Tax=Mangrovimonas spongiae TaxID=2494697 RepID=A0A3R9USI0_9FLAO|nr:DUF4369 domain-containing protein [Mangrovimonas spongiae]RSK39211.1 DUF4369 domain-containing protein [Mangrovimonas spongiae]